MWGVGSDYLIGMECSSGGKVLKPEKNGDCTTF